MAVNESANPHLFVTLPPVNPGYISPSARFRHVFVLVIRVLQRKTIQKQH
jgi:hypothetical protein